MKQNYLKLFFAVLFFASASVKAQVIFSYTGATDTYVVPVGITKISIEAKGSKGLNDGGSLGGNGATMYGEFTVTPGDVLTFYVGGNLAGSKAGGDGTWVENTTTGALLIIAGGGGGAAYDQPGTGAPTTNDGLTTDYHPGYANGAGGVGGNGGGAGSGSWGTGGGGGWLTAGVSGLGTPGGGTPCLGSAGGDYAAGAGGGYSGGGGVDMDVLWGVGGGGAGGSYNVGDAQVNVAANNAALGQITIDELCSAISVTVSEESICLGESFTLTGTGIGEISWDGGVVNGVAYTPADAGVYSYTSTSDADGDCGFTVDIEVLDLPEVIASVSSDEICDGDTITLTGSGAVEYLWFPMDIVDGVSFVPEVGTYTYTLIGTDGAGCENSAEVEVTVNGLPTVNATATDEEICLGESVTLNGEGATTYVWDAEEDGVAFTPSATGTTTYAVEGTDDNGCSNSASIDVTVYESLEITTTTTINEISGGDGEIDITVVGGNPAYTFDWDNDGTGDFDDTEDLTGLSAGTYTVVVMCDAGCTATTTVTVDSQVGIESENGVSLNVFPNPTVSAITLQFDGEFIYELTAINGARLLNGNAVNQTEISLEEFANGIYFVTIKADGYLNTVKVVKK